MIIVELDSFRRDLVNRVGARADADGLPIHDAFVAEVGDLLQEVGGIDGFDQIHFRGVGERNSNLGIDGYCINDDDDSVDLLIGDFSGDTAASAIPSLTQTKTDRLFSLARSFLRDAFSGDFPRDREPSDPAVQLAIDLKRKSVALRRVIVHAVSDNVYKRDTIRVSEDLSGVQVEFRLWDIAKLYEAFTSAGGQETLTIEISDYCDIDRLPALVVRGREFDTYLLTVPALMLARLYERHGNRLLESNVRSFLSVRGKVNKGIRTTLESAPDRFLAYNNGITATATGVRFSADGISSISDLQIVNGGQTTASLYYVQRDAKSRASIESVAVQMKLVVVDPDLASELVPNISRFANSQNSVNEADFFSNSPFHVRLEQISKRLTTPPVPGVHVQTKWYYERTRGQYQNDKSKLTKSGQKRFDAEYPRSQVISKTDAARYENSWSRLPHLVSRGAQKNFVAFAAEAARRWEADDSAINEKYYRDLVSKAILYNAIRKNVMQSSWYQKGYLANIVTLTIARLAEAVSAVARSGEEFDFNRLWEAQAVPDDLLGLCTEIAQDMLSVLESNRRTRQNVTEWAKDPASWEMAKSRRLSADSAGVLKRYIVPSTAARSAKRAAAQLQKTDIGIDLQTQVLSIPATSWRPVQLRLKELGRLSPKEAGVLSKLANSGGRFVPEVWQCEIALACHVRARESGLAVD
ncbi:AIPR family protein [Dietzia sp. IN118]|uniref:AIPR family protein n=2 Tax=Bacillati TaxID=1783272 RepID=UPI0029397AE1|nr:AIPR family protein [Dietzia sp. IN118]MDV3356577.1 AIPR family protein [Dietzia sp. IN118]